MGERACLYSLGMIVIIMHYVFCWMMFELFMNKFKVILLFSFCCDVDRGMFMDIFTAVCTFVGFWVYEEGVLMYGEFEPKMNLRKIKESGKKCTQVLWMNVNGF